MKMPLLSPLSTGAGRHGGGCAGTRGLKVGSRITKSSQGQGRDLTVASRAASPPALCVTAYH